MQLEGHRKLGLRTMNKMNNTLGKKNTRLSRAGFTLIEIMVALMLAAMSSAGIFRGIVLAKGLNQASEQRVVAFSMARAQMEQVKGREYSTLPSGNTTETGLPLTHLGGEAQTNLTCDRWTIVLTRAAPPRKEVFVIVRWTYRGRNMNEWIRGMMYEK